MNETRPRSHAKLRRATGTILIMALLVACLLLLTNGHVIGRGLNSINLGRIELDVQSEYSHIRVRRNGTMRTMIFVRDSGEEALESQVDLQNPHELHFAYLRYMFLSYAFLPEEQQHKRVLVVGLGGGSMIHFIKHYDPQCRVDAVEIDPIVVQIAEKYFGVRSDDKVNVITADGFEFLANANEQYDVIYMDAFLKPSDDTDSTGVPLKLRTRQFYESIQQKLSPHGLVVFNINPSKEMREDVETIRESFPNTYVFPLPLRGGQVVVASLSPTRLSERELLRNAAAIDERFEASFSFRAMVSKLRR